MKNLPKKYMLWILALFAIIFTLISTLGVHASWTYGTTNLTGFYNGYNVSSTIIDWANKTNLTMYLASNAVGATAINSSAYYFFSNSTTAGARINGSFTAFSGNHWTLCYDFSSTDSSGQRLFVFGNNVANQLVNIYYNSPAGFTQFGTNGAGNVNNLKQTFTGTAYAELCFAVNGTSIQGFINGTLVNTTTYSTLNIATGSTNILDNAISGNAIIGNVTKLAMWNYTLNATQISDWYSMGTWFNPFLGTVVNSTTNFSISVNDTRTGSLISGFSYNWTNSNASDTLANINYYCSGTSCSLSNYTGILNISVWNVSGGYFDPYDSPKLNFNYTTSNTSYVFNTYKNDLQLNITNIVNSSLISNFCAQISNSSYSQNNCTTNGLLYFVNLSGSITVLYYNMSSNTYFNVTHVIGNYNSTMQNFTNSTYQAVLNVSASTLYMNTSISSFNITNSLLTNSTTTGSLLIFANNGSNNIRVNVSGNYTINTTCTINTPLSTQRCNAYGVYDSIFNVTAKNYTGNTITTFSVYVTNTSVLNNTQFNATTGYVLIPLLQGYYYNLTINASSSSIGYTSQIATTNFTNISITLQLLNTFEFTFYNETSGNRYNSTVNIVYISLISNGTFANNYSLNTSANYSIILSLLTPQQYTIQYYIDPQLPRNYFTTLTPQSYNNISLFIIDTNISTIYLPVVYNENLQPVSGATIQLLRYYIDSATQTGSYKVVEMTQTDTNGQGVLRVVPNTISYKLIISLANNSVTTTPTKFTSSTNGYTLSTQGNIFSQQSALQNFGYVLTYNTTTQTFVYTFSDSSLIISNTCLTVTKVDNKIGTTGIVSTQCTNAPVASGSYIYTINDTNNTIYTAVTTAYTNTSVATLNVNKQDFTSTSTNFGIIGVIITLMVLLTIGMAANESGLDGLVIASVLGITFFGTIGIFTYDRIAWLGVIITGIVLIYKMRR